MAARNLGFNHGSECPVNIAAVYGAYATDVIDELRGVRIDRLRHWQVCSARWESGEWIASKHADGTTQEALWNHLYSLTRAKSTLWIFGHGMQQQAELLGMLGEIEKQSLRWLQSSEDAQAAGKGKRYGVFIPDGLPWYFRGTFKGRSVRIVDVCNYVKATMQDYLVSSGITVANDPMPCPPAFDYAAVAGMCAEALHIWACSAISAWRQRDCGTWQPTASKLALNAFKHWSYKREQDTDKGEHGGSSTAYAKVRHRQITSHNDKQTQSLERAAYHGGQAEAYIVGTLSENVHSYDVRAMYPYVASTARMPCKHYITRGNISPELLTQFTSEYVAIADVTINGIGTQYPLKVTPAKPAALVQAVQAESLGEWYGGPCTIYPDGMYRTVLAGAELEYALASGHVEKVHLASLYLPGNIFGTFFEEWHELRCKAERAGNDIEADLCKLVCNALIGKLGEKASVWRDCPDMISADPWRHFYASTAGGTKWERFRSIGHNVQRYEGPAELEYSTTFIPACITAAGRIMMRGIRDSLPAGSVILQDTDGIIVTDAAHNILKRRLPAESLAMGGLRWKRSGRSMEVIGPRHYRFDDEWILAGLRKGWEWSGPGQMAAWVSDWLFSRMHALPHGSFASILKPWTATKLWSGRFRSNGQQTLPLLVRST